MTGVYAQALVVLAALYLLGLGTAALLAPARATRFLSGFAGSARAHYLELAIRLVVGSALVALVALALGAFMLTAASLPGR